MKHFTAITVSALVDNVIITRLPNRIKTSISIVQFSLKNDMY